MRRLLPALLLVLTLALAACGEDEADPPAGGGGGGGGAAQTSPQQDAGLNEYPEEAVDNFMRSCTSQQGATEDACRCILNRIRARFTFEEFRRAEQALVRGESSGLNLEALARGCVGGGGSGDGGSGG